MGNLAEFEPRNEGCEAILFDDGKDQKIPVCMGGTALIGCNNPDECSQLYTERLPKSGSVHVIFRNEEGTKVRGITTVPRGPLVVRPSDG